jgi:hypothetical protein
MYDVYVSSSTTNLARPETLPAPIADAVFAHVVGRQRITTPLGPYKGTHVSATLPVV